MPEPELHPARSLQCKPPDGWHGPWISMFSGFTADGAPTAPRSVSAVPRHSAQTPLDGPGDDRT